MPRLSEDITDARRVRAYDEILGDIGRASIHLPTPWLRVSTAARVVYSRQIRGGRQVVATDGWDVRRQAHTWELTTHWDDARGREISQHDTLTDALRVAGDAR